MTQPLSLDQLNQQIRQALTANTQGSFFSANDFSQRSTQKHLASSLSTADKLNLLGEVIQEIENEKISQAQDKNELELLSNVDNSSVDSKAFSPTSSFRKESSDGMSINLTEQLPNVQYVEEEKSPELSPEVEKFIQDVQKNQDKAPKEIVIADQSSSLPADDQYVAEKVVVLPITPDIEKLGKNKSPKLSIRWLVEWSQKIVKMFQGKVIYQQETNVTN